MGAEFALTHSGYDLALRIIYGLILIWAWLIYFDIKPWNRTSLWKLVRGIIALKIAYSVSETISQYLLWSQNGLTKIFLTSPSTDIFNFKGGFFLFYALNRFWGGMVLGIFVAWLFYKFLLYLKKYNERFFTEGEVELGFLTALLVGWPNFVLFLPAFLVFVVLIALIRRIWWHEEYTSFGIPMLLAASTILAFEPYFSSLFGLSYLKL
jgi:hypothetical protein